MLRLGRHLGARVSALVDGQLAPHVADRAWDHVQRCDACRGAVEREAWVKNQLLLMAADEPPAALAHHLAALPGSLAAPAPAPPPTLDGAPAGWPVAGEPGRRHRRLRTGLTVAGAGSVSMAVLGLAAVGALPDGAGPPGAGTSGAVSPGVVSPAVGGAAIGRGLLGETPAVVPTVAPGGSRPDESSGVFVVPVR